MKTKRNSVLLILVGILVIAGIMTYLLLSKNDETKNNKKSTEEVVSTQDETEPEVEKVGNDSLEAHSDDEHYKSSETIYTAGKDSTNLGSYNLSKPTKLPGSLFPGFNRNIISVHNDYVYMFIPDDKIITVYNPKDMKTFNIAENVTQAKFLPNQQRIVFEQETDKGYGLNIYDYKTDKFGLEEVVVLESKAVDFGLNGDFLYYSVKEQPNKYMYQPIPQASNENLLIGFQQLNASAMSSYYDKGFVTYDKTNRKFSNGEFGKKQEEYITFPEEYKALNLYRIEVNPYKEDKFTYLTLFGQSEELGFNDVSSAVLINGTLSPDLESVLNLQWIDEESILYTEASMNEDLYLYNFKTQEKHLIASDVDSFAYDNESKTIYYIQYGVSQVNKISVNE